MVLISGEGTSSEFGMDITFYWQGDEFPFYSTTNGLNGTLNGSHGSGFYYYDNGWKKIEQSTSASDEHMVEITTLTVSNYVYYPETLVRTPDPSSEVGLSRESVEYQLLFGGDTYYRYGLASQSWKGTETGDSGSYGYFGVFNGLVGNLACVRCNNIAKTDYGDVRPVVSLESDIVLTQVDGGWEIKE